MRTDLDPHGGARVASAGAPPAEARGAVILVHGRGATAEGMLDLARGFRRPEFAYLAPQASGRTWYPRSFLAPLEDNEPWLSSALALLAGLVEEVEEAVGAERLVVLGFSQGGCLGLEFAARNARRYGGVVGLSAGLIGPEGAPREYGGDLAGTPVLLGCSDADPHVPPWRVEETAEIMEGLGARVTTRIYPGMGHTVNEDEIELVGRLLDSLPE